MSRGLYQILDNDKFRCWLCGATFKQSDEEAWKKHGYMHIEKGEAKDAGYLFVLTSEFYGTEFRIEPLYELLDIAKYKKCVLCGKTFKYDEAHRLAIKNHRRMHVRRGEAIEVKYIGEKPRLIMDVDFVIRSAENESNINL